MVLVLSVVDVGVGVVDVVVDVGVVSLRSVPLVMGECVEKWELFPSSSHFPSSSSNKDKDQDKDPKHITTSSQQWKTKQRL